MRYDIVLIPSAQADLRYLKAYEQRIIVAGIKTHLAYEAAVESSYRKVLRPNELATWELKIGIYRAFYDVEQGQRVSVVAVGYKAHNDLFIRGKRVLL